MTLFNPLDALFRDVKQQIYNEEQAKARREAKKAPPPTPLPSPYTNPKNWRAGKAILIEHASEGFLGIFREYFYLDGTTRRLLPVPEATTLDSRELVFGDWWLHPRNTAPSIPQDSPAEIAVIRRRFLELLEETKDIFP